MENIKSSYSSADGLPAKLIQDTWTINQITDYKKIPPVHIQFMPTNKCNLNCSYCSCANDDRKKEMDISTAYQIIEVMAKAGTRAVTITGGGESLMYSRLFELIQKFLQHDIEVGLVTNGVLLPQHIDTIKGVKWIRISNNKTLNKDNLIEVINHHQDIDWAFSQVVTKDTTPEEIIEIINFANSFDNITHIRLVSDLLDDVKNHFENLKSLICNVGSISLDKVLFQNRETTKGGDCYICYLKPVIDAHGNFYTCCAAQYALENPTKKMPKEMCLGKAVNFLRLDSSKPFDGSICKRCSYMKYNTTLKLLLEDINHKNFI